MAFIMEAAGGKASDGRKRLLEVEVNTLHQRSGTILGSWEDVEEVEEYYRKWDKNK